VARVSVKRPQGELGRTRGGCGKFLNYFNSECEKQYLKKKEVKALSNNREKGGAAGQED